MIDGFSSQAISPQLRTVNTESVNSNNSNGTATVLKTEQTQNEAKTGQKKFQEENSNQAVSKKQVQDVVEGLNQFLQPTHTSLHFKYHEKLNEYYVQVVDQNTNETIREIPSEKVLDMYASMLEYVGILVDKKI